MHAFVAIDPATAARRAADHIGPHLEAGFDRLVESGTPAVTKLARSIIVRVSNEVLVWRILTWVVSAISYSCCGRNGALTPWPSLSTRSQRSRSSSAWARSASSRHSIQSTSSASNSFSSPVSGLRVVSTVMSRLRNTRPGVDRHGLERHVAAQRLLDSVDHLALFVAGSEGDDEGARHGGEADRDLSQVLFGRERYGEAAR